MKINQAFAILQNAGGVRAARTITENTKKLTRIKVWIMAAKLRRGVPVAKIIHQKWFFGMKFFTNNFTLDPRPDTETLVSAVIADCTESKKHNILDLGTGTGCIIAALVKNIPDATGIAMEKSWFARRVARKNIRMLGLAEKISVRRGDFGCNSAAPKAKFDIIVSNPPYIAKNDPRINVGALHDPKMALYAQDNGLAAYAAIAKNAPFWIVHGGKIYMEIGINQDAAVQEIFTRNNWIFIRKEYDLAGIARVLIFQYK